MTCGIYQILNTVSNKSYIGQSRNIKRRWRQHTRGLEKDKEIALNIGSYPLRSAFLKYSLRQVVSNPGKVGVFDFKVIEECQEASLLERERFWIEKLRPEYNCNKWTPSRNKKSDKSDSKNWLQYHNYDKLGYLPAEGILDNDWYDYQYDSPVSGISTNKRAVLNSQGDTAFLIVGVGTGKRQKQYYLWSVITIEEVLINEEEEGQFYDAFGDGWLLDSPPLLNSERFNEFKSFCGNFGFGFMAIQNSSYLKELQYLAEKHKPREAKIDFANYVEDFYRCFE